MLQSQGMNVAVAGIPKTIDNDVGKYMLNYSFAALT
jgi:6-phosphofructokinase